MMNQRNPQIPDQSQLLQLLAQKTGRDPAQMQQELSQGDVSGILGTMDASLRTTAEKVLADPALMQQMLQSPQIKELLKKLTGG